MRINSRRSLFAPCAFSMRARKVNRNGMRNIASPAQPCCNSRGTNNKKEIYFLQRYDDILLAFLFE